MTIQVERQVPEGTRYLRSLQPPARWFHASASLQRRAVGEATWRAAYTFGLVRNPYARQVSMFHFLLGEVSCARPIGQRPQHCELRKLPEPGPWLKDPALAAPRFRKWLRDMRAAFPPGTAHQHLFGSRSHGNEADAWFNASQISWFVGADGRTSLVDDILRLEDLNASWPALRRRVCGLRDVSYADGGLRKNPSVHTHYSYYYDAETRRIVDEYMGVDLARFGYTFEERKEAAAGGVATA